MDTIILAAGENLRLQVTGLAPGRKPLILHEGEVLIRRLARQAREMYEGDLVIVCAPSNVEDIVFATREFDPLLIVQPRADGPQHAVDLALRTCKAFDLCLLMGDNWIDKMPQLVDATTPKITATRSLNDPRFHLLSHGRFVIERRPPSSWYPEEARWLGPVYFQRNLWHRFSKDWIEAFAGTTFTYIWNTVVKDLGTVEDV